MGIHPKLEWVPWFVDVLAVALGTEITHSIHDHVDPLKKLLVLELKNELRKGDAGPIRGLVEGFAEANDCVIERIHRWHCKMVVEILTKTRLGPSRKINPLQ